MKRIIAILLSVILLFGVCGCSNKKENPSADQSSNDMFTSENVSENDVTTDNNSSNNTNNSSEISGNNSVVDESSKNLQNIPTPGTENWSTDSNAYILSVSNESIGNFSYYGWYVTDTMFATYNKMTDEHKEKFLEYMFEGEQVNYIAVNVDASFYYQSEETGFDIKTFKEQKSHKKGGLLEEFANRKIPMFVTLTKVPNWMKKGEPYWLQEKYVDTFSRAIANMVYDLRIECGLNIINVAIGDEPDSLSGSSESRNLAHYTDVLPLINKYLEKYGMQDVCITGPETCNISSKWLNTLRSSKGAWSNLSVFSGHDFGTGLLNTKIFNASRVTNKPVFVTSCGILNEHTVAGSFLGVNNNGQETISDYYTSMRNISALLNNINMGANEISMWAPLSEIANVTQLDSKAPNFYHIYYNPNGEVFNNNFATSANFDYYSQALNTVGPGAKIYQCSTDKEGTMGGSFADYTMNATAGRNPDGTWGINIFNKTDSTVSIMYRDMESAPIPQAERTIVVNFDIKGLYGTGAKDFKIYSTNTYGSASEEIGTITLVDGRGTIEVYPLELVSLRSVESIELNNKPTSIKQVIKNLNVSYVDNDYMLSSGEEKKFINKPEMVYYKDYAECGIKFNIKDFAALIGADYEISSDAITVFNEFATLTFKSGDTIAKYSGNTVGSIMLPEKVSLINGEYFVEITDVMAGSIGEIFNVNYKQYINTGLVVVGETDVVNIGRFSQLFK